MLPSIPMFVFSCKRIDLLDLIKTGKQKKTTDSDVVNINKLDFSMSTNYSQKLMSINDYFWYCQMGWIGTLEVNRDIL